MKLSAASYVLPAKRPVPGLGVHYTDGAVLRMNSVYKTTNPYHEKSHNTIPVSLEYYCDFFWKAELYFVSQTLNRGRLDI